MFRVARLHIAALTLSTMALGVSLPEMAGAQQPIEKYAQGEPSPDQVKLNESAVEAILDEDYEKAVGGGVAFLGASAGLWLLAEAEHDAVAQGLDESKRASDGSVSEITRKEALERRDRGDTYSTLALSSAIVGTAAVGFGVYWLVASDGESDTQVSVAPTGDGWSVGLSSRF